MNTEHPDHGPIVEAWLKEPVWLPPSDTARIAQLVHQTPQQRRWWRRTITGGSQSMFNAIRFVVAGVIVAAFGGFMLSGYLPSQQENAQLPAAVAASPGADTPSAAPSEIAETAEPVDPELLAGALVMEPGSGETVAGFTQIGRLSANGDPRFGELQDLQSVGERLVARSSVNESKEAHHDVILHSRDGLTWLPATVPGDDPVFEDLASSGTGLMLAGSTLVDGKREAALWTSSDGVAWTVVPAPAVSRIDQIVLAGDPTVVRTGNRVWVDGDGGEWSIWNKVPNSSILHGPGGLLTWQGGGQDQTVPTWVLHNQDTQSPTTEVVLPEALQWNVVGPNPPNMGIGVFALDDEWVMVGSEAKAPDTIHVSANGLDWQDVPRPPGMSEGAVRWMAQVGDQVQAFGTVAGEDSTHGAIWTWRLGEPVGQPETLEGTGDEWIDAPVAWQGGYMATGYERNRDQYLTLWQMGAVDG